MAAPRRWSDEQRGAIWLLHEQGHKPTAIHERMAAGTASTAPVEIPRKTIENIVRSMERERRDENGESLENVSRAEVREMTTPRIRALVDRELSRLERHAQARTLRSSELESLAKIAKINRDLERPTRKAPATSPRTRRAGSDSQPATPGTPPPEFLDRLVEEAGATERDESGRLPATSRRESEGVVERQSDPPQTLTHAANTSPNPSEFDALAAQVEELVAA